MYVLSISIRGPSLTTPHVCADWLSANTYFVFELIVLLLTWIKTYPALRLLKVANIGTTRSLFYIIFRDGTCQFIESRVLIVVSVVSMLSRVWQPLYYPLILSDTVVSVTISRFIFNIRRNYVDEITEGSELVVGLDVADLEISHVQFGVTDVENHVRLDLELEEG
ncbi:hypothetical protein BDY19DRAFT_979966 [Irpex rosettiformis]|uniref:Uncharacterized protein n=1 Tax=Irpex rosettiformis TaxID=378272 RepID=A0ACB8TMN3_9APHY|nr:hypothetical protein BDY19DRAFT_979966 [Irpex rosettiformis]